MTDTNNKQFEVGDKVVAYIDTFDEYRVTGEITSMTTSSLTIDDDTILYFENDNFYIISDEEYKELIHKGHKN